MKRLVRLKALFTAAALMLASFVLVPAIPQQSSIQPS
jgi:hypothetical protein